MRLSICLGLVASIWAIGTAASNAQSTVESQITQATFAQNALHDAQDPLEMGPMAPSDIEGSPRHRQEKAQLMERMDRKQGNWGTSHPRYRLLESLFGFTRYRDRSMDELDRWRRLYKNVGKKQKRVRELSITALQS